MCCLRDMCWIFNWTVLGRITVQLASQAKGARPKWRVLKTNKDSICRMCVFFYHQLTSETKHFQCVHATASSKSLRGLCRRRGNFVDAYDVRVCVATWNVNGGKLFRSIAFKDKVMS